MAGGITLKQLLDEKLASPTEAEDLFANFLYRRKKRLGDRQNEYLSEQFKAITRKAQGFFISRQVREENEMLPGRGKECEEN